MTRPTLALALLLTTATGCVPRAYAPAVYGTAAAGVVAASGEWYAVEGWVRTEMEGALGKQSFTRPETWLLHAGATLGACAIGALLAWDKEACIPAALTTVIIFGAKEVHEWGHPHFSKLDGVMDFVAPATTAGLLTWWLGIPAWHAPTLECTPGGGVDCGTDPNGGG